MLFALIFFTCHWYLSLFTQTFFLHRYSSHKQFGMSPFWERCFYLLTCVLQGPSFLNPRAYALMHRAHHQHSDTVLDPHSPRHSKGIIHMSVRCYHQYLELLQRPITRANNDIPRWELIDRIGDSWWTRFFWVGVYCLICYNFAPLWLMFVMVPLHSLMGPIQGAMVNWFGHKLGYRNHNLDDESRNTLVWDLLLMGELYQNNHHRFPKSSNFANKWYEIDPTYFIILILNKFNIIQLKGEFNGTRRPSKQRFAT